MENRRYKLQSMLQVLIGPLVLRIVEAESKLERWLTNVQTGRIPGCREKSGFNKRRDLALEQARLLASAVCLANGRKQRIMTNVQAAPT
jgi:hypothetical protein